MRISYIKLIILILMGIYIPVKSQDLGIPLDADIETIEDYSFAYAEGYANTFSHNFADGYASVYSLNYREGYTEAYNQDENLDGLNPISDELEDIIYNYIFELKYEYIYGTKSYKTFKDTYLNKLDILVDLPTPSEGEFYTYEEVMGIGESDVNQELIFSQGEEDVDQVYAFDRGFEDYEYCGLIDSYEDFESHFSWGYSTGWAEAYAQTYADSYSNSFANGYALAYSEFYGEDLSEEVYQEVAEHAYSEAYENVFYEIEFEIYEETILWAEDYYYENINTIWSTCYVYGDAFQKAKFEVEPYLDAIIDAALWPYDEGFNSFEAFDLEFEYDIAPSNLTMPDTTYIDSLALVSGQLLNNGTADFNGDMHFEYAVVTEIPVDLDDIESYSLPLFQTHIPAKDSTSLNFRIPIDGTAFIPGDINIVIVWPVGENFRFNSSSTQTFVIDLNPTPFFYKQTNSTEPIIQFDIWPNPASQNLSIAISSETENPVQKVELFTNLGQLIKEEWLENDGNTELIWDLSLYSRGNYFIKVISEEKKWVKQFILQD